MEYKKTIILLALVVFLLSIAGVSASEIDDTLASEDTNTIELSIDNDIKDNLQTSEENEALASTDYDEAIAQTDTEVLGADSATYFDLAQEIGQPGNINLIHKNYTYDGGEPITISEDNKVIDGNGAVIDMNGSTIRAFYISGSGVTIKNLTIINANIAGSGGAIYFSNLATSGTVSNCNFTNNTATSQGGAIRFSSTGTVTNCNFINNKATGTNSWGGAVFFYDEGTVSNCNFINNKATGTNSGGGVVYFEETGTVSNCNFTGNNATTGSAIYFYKWSPLDTLTVSNSTFLNNRANAEALDVVKNDNNITITFTGQNNLLNAIYSRNGAVVTFTNVTYWGADGITTVSATMSGSNKAAGQNITVKGVVNGKIIDKINGTDENGEIVLDDAGDYWIIVSHKGDLYYTEIAETLFTNMKLYANVTSLTTNNKTVNITAKSNIFSEVMPGKLLFILPDGTADGMVIEANYACNGTWWAVHTFDDYGVYQVNATYIGLDNVSITNATFSIMGLVPISVNDVNITFGEAADIIVIVPESIGGQNLTITVNGISINATVKDGEAQASFTNLPLGEYEITVNYLGDDRYVANSTTANLTVNKGSSQVSSDGLTTTYQVHEYLKVNLKDGNGNPITGVKVNITINGVTYNCWVDENGDAELIIRLNPDTYTATVTFENGNYNKSTATAKVTVKKATPKLTAKAKAFKKALKTKKYTVVLKDNLAKAIKKAKLTLKIKGKTYTARTNSKGKTTFKITKLTKKGTFNAKITYKGNKFFNKAAKTVKIKVK